MSSGWGVLHLMLVLLPLHYALLLVLFLFLWTPPPRNLSFALTRQSFTTGLRKSRIRRHHGTQSCAGIVAQVRSSMSKTATGRKSKLARFLAAF